MMISWRLNKTIIGVNYGKSKRDRFWEKVNRLDLPT
jgi:hypothetical protein